MDSADHDRNSEELFIFGVGEIVTSQLTARVVQVCVGEVKNAN